MTVDKILEAAMTKVNMNKEYKRGDAVSTIRYAISDEIRALIGDHDHYAHVWVRDDHQNITVTYDNHLVMSVKVKLSKGSVEYHSWTGNIQLYKIKEVCIDHYCFDQLCDFSDIINEIADRCDAAKQQQIENAKSFLEMLKEHNLTIEQLEDMKYSLKRHLSTIREYNLV